MPAADTHELAESDLLEPLLAWLERRRQLTPTAIVTTELAWSGRRIDLAILTPSDTALAFELKLRHNTRAIEQAALNARAFDRSYVVTMTRPSASNVQLASALGVGIILVSSDLRRISLVVRPTAPRPRATVRRRLRVTLNASARQEVWCSRHRLRTI